MCFQITHVIGGNKVRVVWPILDNCEKRQLVPFFLPFTFLDEKREEGKTIITGKNSQIILTLTKVSGSTMQGSVNL